MLSTPAAAWEFSPVPVCTLTQETDAGTVTVTHDPRRAEPYAIALDLKNGAWAGAPVFALRFDGPGPRTITTDRHQLSPDASRLTVTDTGFGNVLAGMATNFVAMAVLGDQSLVIPLSGARPEVERFMSCLSAPTA